MTMPTAPSVSISTFQVQEAGERALDVDGVPGKGGGSEEESQHVAIS